MEKLKNLILLMIGKSKRFYDKELFQSAINRIEYDNLFVKSDNHILNRIFNNKLSISILYKLKKDYSNIEDSREEASENDLESVKECFKLLENRFGIRNDVAFLTLKNTVIRINSDEIDLLLTGKTDNISNVSDFVLNYAFLEAIISSDKTRLEYLIKNKLLFEKAQQYKNFICSKFKVNNVWEVLTETENRQGKLVNSFPIFRIVFKLFEDEYKSSNACLTDFAFKNKGFITNDFDFYKNNIYPIDKDKYSLMSFISNFSSNHVFDKRFLKLMNPNEKQKIELFHFFANGRSNLRDSVSKMATVFSMKSDIDLLPDFTEEQKFKIEDKILFVLRLFEDLKYIEERMNLVMSVLESYNFFNPELVNKYFTYKNTKTFLTALAAVDKKVGLFEICMRHGGDVQQKCGTKTLERKILDNASIGAVIKPTYTRFVMEDSLAPISKNKSLKM